jgi:8-oxo-dGTP diphosphatase
LDIVVVTFKKVPMKDCNVDWHNWQGEMLATLMFIVQDGQILLIEKLRGIGKGKINGPGGKIDPGETPEECVIRECQEELHITPKAPIKMGELWFAMSDMEDIHCHVFMAYEFDGVPTSTDEAIPAWTALDKIPWERMWEDDPYWLPHMLEGEKFLGKFVFEGESIQWSEMQLGNGSLEGWLQKACS